MNSKWMYDIIYRQVLPRWQRYLSSKSQRSIHTLLRIRQDTLWKKIFRDVREFFRILFRARFYFLEFKDKAGEIRWVQMLFYELGIPLTEENTDYINLFKFVHQTHKLNSTVSNNKSSSPYEAIEKFKESYKRLFMTNITCARMFYFVFQNFTEEYYHQVNPRHRNEVITMICMVLNCYKRMSSCHHIKRMST